MSPSQGRCRHIGQHKGRINAHRHPFLKWYSNPRSQCFEQAKTIHAFDHAATVIGMKETRFHKFILLGVRKYSISQCGKWIKRLVLNRVRTFVKDETFKHVCGCRVSLLAFLLKITRGETVLPTYMTK
jgi:hypothetical protein